MKYFSLGGTNLVSEMLYGQSDAMTFPRKLRLIMTDKGISGAEIARVTGASEPTVSRWKKDINYDKHGNITLIEPTLSQAVILARHLGYSLDYMTDDSQPYPPLPDKALGSAILIPESVEPSDGDKPKPKRRAPKRV